MSVKNRRSDAHLNDVYEAEKDSIQPITRLKVYIETYGCQMNVSDTEIVLSILTAAGHVRCKEITEADLVITNTCAVRENAGWLYN